jgi:nicotinamide-nucleotide amidase
VGVPPELVATHGAVSEPVAWALADGVRERFAADLGVGVTGIAGPDGGSPEKPVGTVHVAVVGPSDRRRHRAFRLPGDRERIRRQASQAALELVRRQLLDLPPLGP